MIEQADPIVALVGRPNVGKSSLFNRIARKNKAIIDASPGVTRDRHYEQVRYNDKSFILIDTGGIELDKATSEQDSDPEKKVSLLIREQSWQAVAEADILVFMLDAKEGLVRDDYEILSQLRRSQKPLYLVVNKIDDIEQENLLLSTFYEVGSSELYPLSAAHGHGVIHFLDALTQEMISSADAEEVTDATGIAVACIGRPNVGKSSLINKIVGEERMVVSDVPGTTRDSVDTLFQYRGKDYLFIDTAGIRRKGKVRAKVEKYSVIRALRALERCDIALILIDAVEGITEQDTKVIGYCMDRGRACLVILNKWDLVKQDGKKQKWILSELDRATRFVGYAPRLKISALTGMGVKKIFNEIDAVYRQFSLEFTTGQLNRVLEKATQAHPPSLYKGKRLKFYYTTQVSTKPPTFLLFVNYPKGVHFSYYRFLVNQFREELNLDRCTLRLILRERNRRDLRRKK